MSIFSHLPIKEKMFFAQHLSIMAKSGMQILDILRTLKKQTKSRLMGKILDSLIENVKAGQFLSDGLKKYRNVFGDFFINIVRVGEVSGSLSENLAYLSESLKKNRELQGKVKGVLAYPIIIVIATLGLSAGLTFFVFPKILPIFQSLNIDLPLITKIFVVVANFMIAHGIVVFAVIIAIGIGLWLILQLQPVRHLYHRLLLFIPIVGVLVRNYNLVNFIRSLSLLMKSGVKIVSAIEITASSATSLVYRDALTEVAAGVRQGDRISKNLANHPRLFPPIFTEMIAVGEETGSLSETGTYLAEYYESELDNSTKALSNILEPLLLVAMGGVVLFIALAIILPIYKVSQNIKA